MTTLDRRPPLILDDPFVTFDSARAERALRLVKQLSQEHGFQVLLLTCSDRFDRLADELVVLPGPSSERVLAAPRAARTQVAPREAEVLQPTTREAEVLQPTLVFEPDSRPNPDPVAPRKVAAADEPDSVAQPEAVPVPAPRQEPEPEPRPQSVPLTPSRDPVTDELDPLAALRQAVVEAAEAEHDTGVDDPFQLGERDENGTAD